MAARPIWKGALKISLVTLPIKVFPATESSGTISFNQLHDACQSRVQQKRWCATCAREVPTSEIVKGFEFEKGRYVVLIDEEFDAVQPPSTRVIDLVAFAEASALPWRAIDRTYYLVPDGPENGPAQQAYAILVEALAGRLGVGTLAIYGREYLVAVSPQAGSLLLYTLHHAAEQRDAPYVAPDPRAARGSFRLPAEEVTLAQRVIQALSGPLDLNAFTDQYQADLRRLIDAKIAGEEIVVPPVETPGAVLSFKASLEQSLEAVGATKKTRKRAS